MLVNGAPASGKTTLASYLSDELRLPLLAKDAIKERLFDTLGSGDREWSRRLGRAAYAVLWEQVDALLGVGRSAVVDAPLGPEYEDARLSRLTEERGARTLQLWLSAPPAVLRERFVARDAGGERHPGHVDAAGVDASLAKLAQFQPLTAVEETITVDASDLERLDREALATQVRRWIESIER